MDSRLRGNDVIFVAHLRNQPPFSLLAKRPGRMFAQGPRWTAIYSLSADTIFVERLY
jgi:hypothetical protein